MAVKEPTALTDFAAAGNAEREAGKLIEQARVLDQRRRELFAEAAYQQNLGEVLRERGRARGALDKAQKAEADAETEYDAAVRAEADMQRRAMTAQHEAEQAQVALDRAARAGAEPGELTELDVRATSAGRTAEHQARTLDGAREDRQAAERVLGRVRQAVEQALEAFDRAVQAAENPPRPAAPPSEVTFGDIFADTAARLMAQGFASGRR
jgi:tetratricopeptide (TPR) repeat protein